jgi:hypothetical protein
MSNFLGQTLSLCKETNAGVCLMASEIGTNAENTRLPTEAPKINRTSVGLDGWCGRTANGSCRVLGSILRWLAYAFRKWHGSEQQEVAVDRASKSTLRRLESAATAPNSSILPNDQNISGESREICGHGNWDTGETQPGVGQRGIGKGTMPFLHLGIKRESSNAPDNEAIETILDKAKDWYRYAPNCWLIYTGRDAKWWYEKLSDIPQMKGNASFLVCEISLDQKNKRAGWLGTSAWQWINKDRS